MKQWILKNILAVIAILIATIFPTISLWKSGQADRRSRQTESETRAFRERLLEALDTLVLVSKNSNLSKSADSSQDIRPLIDAMRGMQSLFKEVISPKDFDGSQIRFRLLNNDKSPIAHKEVALVAETGDTLDRGVTDSAGVVLLNDNKARAQHFRIWVAVKGSQGWYIPDFSDSK